MKMKSAALAAFILLAASFPALAKKNPARLFFLPTPVTMDGAEIPAGMYRLALESGKSSVRVTFWKDGQFVATAHGVWVKSGVKYAENAILLRVNTDGSRSLIEIRLSGAAKTILLQNSDTVVRYSAK